MAHRATGFACEERPADATPTLLLVPRCSSAASGAPLRGVATADRPLRERRHAQVALCLGITSRADERAVPQELTSEGDECRDEGSAVGRALDPESAVERGESVGEAGESAAVGAGAAD